MQRLALVTLVSTAPIAAYGEQSAQAIDDSALIKMMNAQIHALDEYARCLEDHGGAIACEPPRPLQLLLTEEPSPDRDMHSEAMVDSAARMLKDAEIRAIKAHAKCVKMKQTKRCGRSP